MAPIRDVKDVPSIFSLLQEGPLNVAMIGNGSWGSAATRVMAQNVAQSYIFSDKVLLYCHPEDFNGRPLHDQINETHENGKYLPGVNLGGNVVATTDLKEVCQWAHLICFCIPHQFIPATCKKILAAGGVRPGVRGISLCKGMFVHPDGGPQLITDFISESLGMPMSVLSGANVAMPIAKEEFTETSIGFREWDSEAANIFQTLFDRPYFKVDCVPDVAGVEICGALKNVVALAAGFCDGMGLSSNAKASIIRLGFEEMRAFGKDFFEGVRTRTFQTSAGIADLITTCYGGRNRKCAEEFARHGGEWSEIEKRLLNGQKLQGTLTAQEVHEMLEAKGKTEMYPFFEQVYKIAFEGADLKSIITIWEVKTHRPILKNASKL